MAVIYLAVFHKLKVPIVAGSADKANKIMEYVVQHIGDHPKLYEGLINVQKMDEIDKLKIKVSKEALRWSQGGWVYITSIDSRNISREGEGVVGEGGDVVILEEAGLIKRKEQFSKVVRMPEEDNGWGKLVQSGNCIENSVFEDAYNDPLYHKVRISLEQSVKEGRYTQEKLDEKKAQTTTKDWKRYYLVLFPAPNEFTFFKPKKMESMPHELLYYGACDPNLGETKKGSLAAIVVVGVDKGNQIYEVESIGMPLGPDKTMNAIFNLPYKFQRFGVEDVQFQKYFKNQMDAKSKELGLFIPFEGISQKRKKEERIESLEPIINTGQVLFRGNNLLWEHMQDYPEPDHLDLLDALEMVVRMVRGKSFDFSFV